MDLTSARTMLLEQLIAAAERDPRIVGLLDYGSSSEGRADAWSDVDVALIIRDTDLEQFEVEWKHWASQFGPLLLAWHLDLESLISSLEAPELTLANL